jgi:ribosome biogenesis GTPase
VTLEQLGWNEPAAKSLQESGLTDVVPARVARQDKLSYVVYTANRAMRAAVSGAFRHRAARPNEFPAVGDWVAVRPRSGQEAATIHAVLPRRTVVSRRAAGDREEAQVIAANVDSLMVCCGLDRDYNVRRIERYLTVAYASGAAPVIILTKADLCAGVDVPRAEVEALAVGAPVLCVSIQDAASLEAVRRMIPPGRTAALVGSSGVGKSTLINGLLGWQALKIGAVREFDGRGRHTTTHRQLLPVPGGGVIIDTPGMRELQLWADEDHVSGSFADIESLAAECRYRDCSHSSEPGCAVLAASVSGRLAPQRLMSYRKQLAELRYVERRDEPELLAAEKARWKAVHKSARKWMKAKYRY